MNKILPIILVVVLSGNTNAGWFDGKTPLENCADSEYSWRSYAIDDIRESPKYQSYRFESFFKALDFFIKNKDYRGDDNRWKRIQYLKRSNIKYKDYKQIHESDFNEIKERTEELESLPVEKKLKMNRSYFYEYVGCEKKREHYPATFENK